MTAVLDAPAVEADLDAELVCMKKGCDAAAEWQVRAHLPNSHNDAGRGCETRTVNLCTLHKGRLIAVDPARLPSRCPCGKWVTQVSDFILWVRRL